MQASGMNTASAAALAEPAISIRNVSKVFGAGEHRVVALSEVAVDNACEHAAYSGPS